MGFQCYSKNWILFFMFYIKLLFNLPIFSCAICKYQQLIAGLGGSLGCESDWWSGGCGFDPRWVGNILSWRLIMKYFLRSFSSFRWFKKGSCQFLSKEFAHYCLTAYRTIPTILYVLLRSNQSTRNAYIRLKGLEAIDMTNCFRNVHIITKTRLFKYIENFTSKNWKFTDKKFWHFSYFCSKHRMWVLIRTASLRRF